MDSGQDQNPVKPTETPKTKNKKVAPLIILVVLLAIAGIGAWMLKDKESSPQPQTSTTDEVVPAEGSATMTVSSDTQQATVGNVVTFKVYVNSDDTEVNGVGVRASFSTDSFDFVGISYEGSAFEMQAKEEVADGKIILDRATGIDSAANKGRVLTGENLVATITLKATKASTGSGLTIDDSSILIQSSDAKNILKTRQGAQIEVVEE
jgi:hypothetical protein